MTEKKPSGLKQRTITGLSIGIPMLFLIFFNTETRILMIGLIMFFTAFEYNKLTSQSLSSFLPIFSITISILAILLLFLPQAFYYVLIFSLLFNISLVIELYKSSKTRLTKNGWLNSVFYTTMPLSLLLIGNDSTRVDILFPSILILIWISDISAYLVGKTIGKNKMMPRISPGKSWEGFYGAGLITIMCSYIFFTTTQSYSLQAWAIIGLSTWLFGSIGDLVESKFKRAMSIKDSGTILPGHGGFLDRFDGFYFCIPFVLSLIFVLKYFDHI